MKVILLLIILTSICFAVSHASLAELRKQVLDGITPSRGVNLGGWLVAERWMTAGSPAWSGVPDDIANKGEWSTMQYLGHEKGDVQFDQHRSTYITEKDFQDISDAGLNTVRIPIGYWIVGFDHSWGNRTDTWKVYAPGALDYLDKAIREWAPAHNILVLISYHAAKGSQNGNDNSSPEDLGDTTWFANPANVNNTLDAVEFLANRYMNESGFLGKYLHASSESDTDVGSFELQKSLGIGLLNEPQSNTTDIPILQQYYKDAYDRIRNNVGSDCLLTISPMLYQQKPFDGDWATFMTDPKYYNLRHEWHHYHIWGFGADDQWTPDKIITWINSVETKYYDDWKGNPIFVGEWCIASQFDMDDVTLQRFADAQLNMFKKAVGGWTYWTWRYYNSDDPLPADTKSEWSMKVMIQKGFLKW